ncbi:MAG: radical SAM family heme chaperone HemW [Roseburia inulinivorans]|nr:radical SAM family heme chaperone HemW [bacterium]MDY3040533.1 radical SAM family heme chaperone HemW [Roseburia inulinivorans]
MKILELYIHIPFCVKKCDYCDFLSFAADEQTQKSYVAALQKELAFYGAKYKDRRITTIFIGGGTPSWLKEDYMQAIMETVYHYFSVEQDAEITIECNPGTITEHKFEVYRRIGINRLSIGLQSVHNEELKILGRIHTFEQFLKTYDMARKHGFSNINIDLMSSLPGQTPEIFCDSLYQVLKLKPEHISAYSLIIEKGTPFYELYRFDAVKQAAGMQTESLPTEEEEYQTTKMTQHILKEAGYHWYEISNFAKPGYECRHNIGYWKRVDYLGVGLGASSLIDNVRYSNTRDLYTYLSVPADSLHETAEQITRNEQMEEFMFLGLRMRDGFYRDEFTQAFGIPIEAVYGDALNHLQQEELLLKREGRIYLTDKGMDLNNYVVAQFML